MEPFRLTEDHNAWIDNASKKFGSPPTGEQKKPYLRRLITENNGRCAWSGIPLYFEVEHRTAGRRGCHPFSASLDHSKSQSDEDGHEIVCYVLNDLKGHLPLRCFRALQQTKAWQDLMRRLREQCEKDPHNTDAIQRVVRS